MHPFPQSFQREKPYPCLIVLVAGFQRLKDGDGAAFKNLNPSHLSHLSSFRDSTYTDTIDGGSEGRNDANGIEQIFEGINRDLVTIAIFVAFMVTIKTYVIIVVHCVYQVSLANSGHFADSEGDQGDAEAEEEESLGGDERFVLVIPSMIAFLI